MRIINNTTQIHQEAGTFPSGTPADRAAGILFGIAAGDTIGSTTELALCVAETLLDQKASFDITHVGNRYLQWWRQGGFDDGPVVEVVLSLVDSGLSFTRASWIVHERLGGLTAGCTPAARCVPLAMFLPLADDEVIDFAKADAALTHRSPLAGDVAAAVAMACRMLVRGAEWSWALRLAGFGRWKETQAALHGRTTSGSTRNDGFAPDILGTAVGILNESHTFLEAFSRALEFTDTGSYCTSLVGALGGARWGSTAIPRRMLNHANKLFPRVSSAANALSEPWLTENTPESRGHVRPV